MKKHNIHHHNLPVKGQDFADPGEKSDEKRPSHGEVANQKDGDFSELEKSRMDNPPQHRAENGSGKDDFDNDTKASQSIGVK